jgi:uncharacterized Ntn-hydrolase superfamily protein
MTYTILGHCPRTGQVGIGVATFSLVVGQLCPAIDGVAGVISSQANVNLELRTLGLNLLKQGHPAEHTLALMKQADPNIEWRQLMVVDAFGRSAGFTGSKTNPWTGHKVGPGYVVAGNGLSGEKVIDAMAEAFVKSADEALDERLLRSIEAGRDAGGQGFVTHVTERSAALKVRGRSPKDELDLRVDSHPTAVEQIRAIFTEWQPYRAYHWGRHLDPASALKQQDFVKTLAKTG